MLATLRAGRGGAREGLEERQYCAVLVQAKQVLGSARRALVCVCHPIPRVRLNSALFCGFCFVLFVFVLVWFVLFLYARYHMCLFVCFSSSCVFLFCYFCFVFLFCIFVLFFCLVFLFCIFVLNFLLCIFVLYFCPVFFVCIICLPYIFDVEAR